jgi:hypothetical protein
MTVMIVTFFNASGIDFGNFLNAHLRPKTLSANDVTSTIARSFSRSNLSGIYQSSYLGLYFKQEESIGFKMNSKEFQKTVLESFTRLEEGQTELKEGYAKLEEGQAELKQDIKFVYEDLSSKIEMIADALKQLIEKMDTLVERMITKEDYERRFRDLESRIRELEQK